MLKLRALLLLSLCCAVPAQAGLFSDDDARKQIQQVEARVLKLEEQSKQQTKSILDLQGQIDVLNSELRKLRGQNEELAHGLQDAEKREKDFYVDLDTRLRKFESAADTSVNSGTSTQAPSPASDPNDVAAENRAYETAYGLFKGGSYVNASKAFDNFTNIYPNSVHVPNAHYWLASSLFALRDYEGAMAAYRMFYKEYPTHHKVPDALLGIAACQSELKQATTAQKTLKLLIGKFPQSEAAAQAKQLLTPTK